MQTPRRDLGDDGRQEESDALRAWRTLAAGDDEDPPGDAEPLVPPRQRVALDADEAEREAEDGDAARSERHEAAHPGAPALARSVESARDGGCRLGGITELVDDRLEGLQAPLMRRHDRVRPVRPPLELAEAHLEVAERVRLEEMPIRRTPTRLVLLVRRDTHPRSIDPANNLL